MFLPDKVIECAWTHARRDGSRCADPLHVFRLCFGEQIVHCVKMYGEGRLGASVNILPAQVVAGTSDTNAGGRALHLGRVVGRLCQTPLIWICRDRRSRLQEERRLRLSKRITKRIERYRGRRPRRREGLAETAAGTACALFNPAKECSKC